MTTPTIPTTVQTALRLPIELIQRVDAHVARLREKQPGYMITRSDVIRALLSQGLDAAEKRR